MRRTWRRSTRRCRRALQFILADQAEQVLGAALSVRRPLKRRRQTMNSLSAGAVAAASRLRQ